MNEITFSEAESILKTLPISYYLGRSIPVELSKEASMSYIDLLNQHIVISYPTLSCIRFESMSKEEVIRSNLYHEISHAIFTPIINEIIIDEDIFNIFEDERIEVINANTYMGVDFKENLNLISPCMPPIDAKGEFFNMVRYRVCTPGVNELIDKVIIKWSDLKCNASLYEIKEYQEDIKRLFNLLVKYYESNQSEFDYSFLKFHIDDIVKNSKKNDQTLKKPNLEGIITQISIKPDLEFRKKIEIILNEARTPRGINATSKLTYSGKIVPKQLARPNTDYKWFSKIGDGYLKKNRKIKLNIFADASGSFKPNELEFNKVLYELRLLERKLHNFEFDLITINSLDISIQPKHNRILKCGYGNFLDERLKECYHKLYNPEYQNITIVFSDGDLSTDDVFSKKANKILKSGSKEQLINLKVFNSSNVLIISDYSNAKYFEKYCIKAKVFYTQNYIKEFKKVFLENLEKFLI